ncbi:M23 family metallopeptidase [Kribbella sp. NPDC051952]|uniref:M23 family metallopeptidase n=1 Tax=Kribbella sp. NPDC051952 TaxID=3154851 RepID=UPI003440B1A1
MTAPVHNPEVVREFGTTDHSGRDYRTEPGTPIRASLAGVVVQLQAGRVAVESNAIWHLYDGLSELVVSQGETVETGDRLGVAAGTHLHYEERVAPYRAGDHRSPQFDLHTNARMRVMAPDGSAEEGAAEPSGATVEP